MKAQPLWLGALIAMAIVGCHESSDKKSTETSSAPASLSPVPNLKAFETEIKRNLRMTRYSASGNSSSTP